MDRIDPSGHIAPLIAAALAYLGETAIESVPDVLLDMLIEGDNFTLWKSALGNYGGNLIPGLGEAKTAKQIAKVTEKYGPEVVEYISKHGDDIAKNLGDISSVAGKHWTDGIARYLKAASLGENAASANISKFSDYIFKPGAKHGKDRIFTGLGYGKGNSADLVKIFAEQARQKYLKGDYTLGDLDQHGQRVNIIIDLPGIGNSAGKVKNMISGWMIRSDGSITLNTPFSGFAD